MLDFVTLFLVLLRGPQTIELTADSTIARVELRLDGRVVARVDDPPWRASVDFGAVLEPHRLEAIGFADDGRVVATAGRLVNVTSASYAASIELAPATDDRKHEGRVRWQAARGQHPDRVVVTCDGHPLPVEEDGRFVVPAAVDADRTHVVEARLLFGELEIGAELTFGGHLGERLTSALTAVPVVFPADRPRREGEIAGWMLADRAAAEVFAVRRDPGLVIMLQDVELGSSLRRLRAHPLRRSNPVQFPARFGFQLERLMTRPLEGEVGTFDLLRLGSIEQTSELTRALLADAIPRQRGYGEQALWSAVALAGRHAATSGVPRAVVVVVDADDPHPDTLSAGEAARYLARLHVPLFVLAVGDGRAFATADLPSTARVYRGATGLRDLVPDLIHSLASQTIVWVRGEHLPTEIALSPSAPAGVALVQ